MHQQVEVSSSEERSALVPSGANPAPISAQQTLAQVRTLLFGEAQRQTDDRLSHLFDLLRDVEQVASSRMDTIERQLEQARADLEERRRHDLTAIGDALETLGRDVKRLAEG